MDKKINPTDLDSSFLGHPKPLMSLSLTEVWERFSFYGIRPLLILFMIAVIEKGGLGFDRPTASAIVGIFGGSLYLAALPGGFLADRWLGQKKATFIGAVLIAFGHLSIALAIFHTTMFFIGLVLIVIGTGLFKPCASIMVGMLYKDGDPRRDSGFTIFYMGINLGAFIAPLICGSIQQQYGWHLGFGAGGIGMLIALIIFYFKTIPDFREFGEKVGLDKSWEKPVNKKEGLGLIVFIVAIFIAVFIALCVTGVISLNPTTIAQRMVVFISLGALLYFLYLFFLAGLNSEEKKSLIVFLVLFIASAFFWSTFEQQPTSFNLFCT
ncbi:peptide MFS transporter [Helicobacter enhydrae]